MAVIQTWDPERYAQHARYVADLATEVVELLAPRPGERILDIGCGDGALTEKLVGAGCEVVGVDTSADQVAAAQRRGLDARVVDGERLTFDNEFDAVFSNSALHWMMHADDVIAGVWRALRPGGRFVAEMAGHDCIATIVAALYDALARRGIDGSRLNPWYFPTADDYGRRLTRGGFRVDLIALIRRPTLLPGDIGGWMETFAPCFTSVLASNERSPFVDEVREALRPKLCNVDGRWTADYMILRFAATKPPASARKERNVRSESVDRVGLRSWHSALGAADGSFDRKTMMDVALNIPFGWHLHFVIRGRSRSGISHLLRPGAQDLATEFANCRNDCLTVEEKMAIDRWKSIHRYY
jgi:trans-aconitate methyltransferase